MNTVRYCSPQYLHSGLYCSSKIGFKELALLGLQLLSVPCSVTFIVPHGTRISPPLEKCGCGDLGHQLSPQFLQSLFDVLLFAVIDGKTVEKTILERAISTNSVFVISMASLVYISARLILIVLPLTVLQSLPPGARIFRTSRPPFGLNGFFPLLVITQSQ